MLNENAFSFFGCSGVGCTKAPSITVERLKLIIFTNSTLQVTTITITDDESQQASKINFPKSVDIVTLIVEGVFIPSQKESILMKILVYMIQKIDKSTIAYVSHNCDIF